MADKSHYRGDGHPPHPVAASATGLVPPPPLNWDAWRKHAGAIRADRELSINVLAERSGLDRSTVIELFGGRRGVTGVRLDSLWALAWALETRPEDFPAFLAPLWEGPISPA
jgi:DNA-binding Xre family transcriptional regulator